MIPVIITRFANIYGPGQLNFSALIPAAIRCALGYNEFIPRSGGQNIRDFLFVKDVAKLYSIIAEKLFKNNDLKGEVYNAGTNDGKTVRSVIEDIYNIINNQKDLSKIKKLFDKKTNPIGEINHQIMGYNKVEKAFGWVPETDFKTGLNLTINWYKDYLKK